jgi:endonuclease I
MNRPSQHLLLYVLLLTTGTAVWAQGPNNSGRYYRAANGKAGAELKTAMHHIIRNPKVVGYDGLKSAYLQTDVRPDGYLRDWYSDSTQYEPGSNFSATQKEEGLGYNREHLLPQSWFGKKVDPMYSDITHVVPADSRLNTIRNDNPLADVTDDEKQVNTSASGYSRWGAPHKDLGVPSGLTKVFEPNDELKGDIARIYFYMITCYEDTLSSWPWRDSRTATYVFDEEGTPYEPLLPWVMTMFMRWSEQDPVDSIELARNEAVYRVQGNRNPYVDYPGLEDYVWGDKTEEPFVYGEDDGEEETFKPSVTIALNSSFFGGEWVGSRPVEGASVVHGEQDGITVTYALGNNGRNMYLGNDHIRLYQKNLLEFSSSEGNIEEITFNVTKNDAGKVLMVGDEVLDGYYWMGCAPEVTFHLDEGNGVFYLKSVDIRRSETVGIEAVVATESQHTGRAYDLQGRRVEASMLKRGVYIRDGRKYVVR